MSAKAKGWERRSWWMALLVGAAVALGGGAARADDDAEAAPAPKGAKASKAHGKKAKAASSDAPRDDDASDASADDAYDDASAGDSDASGGEREQPRKGRPGEGEGKRFLKKLHTNEHILVRARDLRLDALALERLLRIGERYFAKTHHKLIITGGMRPPQIQAKLMYDKLVHGDDLMKLYENHEASKEIVDVYRAGVAKHEKRYHLVKAIRDTIVAQLARGVYVSKHLAAGAADVRSYAMSPSDEQALRSAVNLEAGVQMLDERGSAEPHFHLDLVPLAPRGK